jgi:hypothetical protein
LAPGEPGAQHVLLPQQQTMPSPRATQLFEQLPHVAGLARPWHEPKKQQTAPAPHEVPSGAGMLPHVPPEQVSPIVQALPSSQPALLGV